MFNSIIQKRKKESKLQILILKIVQVDYIINHAIVGLLAIIIFQVPVVLQAEEKTKQETLGLVEQLRNKRPSGLVDIRGFQKELDQGTARWVQELESRLTKDSKCHKQHKKVTIPEVKITEEQRNTALRLVESSKPVIDDSFGIDSAKPQDTDFFIFTSFSTGEKNIEHLIKSAIKYNGIVVMRGFKEGSIIKTTTALSKFIEKTGGGVIIDPVLFKKYKIKRVPSFVLTRACDGVGSCKKKYDVLRGNVSPRYALEKFSTQGELKEEAKGRLER